jgi:streptogramin lyase
MRRLLSKRLLLRALVGALAAYGCGLIDRAGAQTISEFAIGGSGSPTGIAAGPDGALWFTEVRVSISDTIGRMTTTGAVTEQLIIPTANSGASAITAGPD